MYAILPTTDSGFTPSPSHIEAEAPISTFLVVTVSHVADQSLPSFLESYGDDLDGFTGRLRELFSTVAFDTSLVDDLVSLAMGAADINAALIRSRLSFMVNEILPLTHGPCGEFVAAGASHSDPSAPTVPRWPQPSCLLSRDEVICAFPVHPDVNREALMRSAYALEDAGAGYGITVELSISRTAPWIGHPVTSAQVDAFDSLFNPSDV